MVKYEGDDLLCMLVTNQVRNKSRIKELIDFAKIRGYVKIGIANCISMQKYADKLKDILENNGFEVFSCNCRESCLDGCDISAELNGSICDPMSQAEYLNKCNTDFNINLGLCLGHGLIFQKYSNADVTTLVVKDFATGHNCVKNLE